MSKSYRHLPVLPLVTWVLLATGNGWAQSPDLPREVVAYADLVVYNGKILTADEQFTVVSAVALRDGKFLATGNNQRILAMTGPETRRVDLEGRSVIPGLIGTHSSALAAVKEKRGSTCTSVPRDLPAPCRNSPYCRE